MFSAAVLYLDLLLFLSPSNRFCRVCTVSGIKYDRMLATVLFLSRFNLFESCLLERMSILLDCYFLLYLSIFPGIPKLLSLGHLQVWVLL